MIMQKNILFRQWDKYTFLRVITHYQQLKNLGIDTQKYSKIFVKYTT